MADLHPSNNRAAPVLVAGAGGRTGRLLVPALLAAGQSVRAMVRRGGASAPPGAALETVTADVTAPSTLPAALRGAGAVISAIGARVPWGAGGFRAIDWEGNRALVDAARDAGVRRFVLITAGSAGRAGFPYALPFAPYPWKGRAEAHLRASGLDYTILGPGGLTDEAGEQRGLRVTGRADYRTGLVTRADLAALAVFCLDHALTIGRTLTLINDATLTPGAWRASVETLPADPAAACAAPDPH